MSNLPPEGELEARVGQLERQALLVETHFTEAFWKALDVAYDAIMPHRQIHCIVCDHTDLRDGFEILIDQCIFHGGRLERYRCPQCECIFGPMKYLDLDEAFVSRDYKLLYSRYSEGDSTTSEIRTFHSLQPEPGATYLDWGSGGPWSRTVAQLRREGWQVLAYEPSAETAGDYLLSRRDALASRFDGIFSNNVIEHFRNPVAQFRQFHDLLNERGVMAHSSPCYDYNVTYTRFHTLFLTGRSLGVLAERTGFAIVNSVRDGDYINHVLSRI